MKIETVEPAALSIHIGQLELHGVENEHRYAISAACERELGLLFEQSSRVIVATPASPEPCTARLEAASSPEALGVAIARAIHRSLSR